MNLIQIAWGASEQTYMELTCQFKNLFQDENNKVVPEQASEETSQNEAKAEPKEELLPKESQSKEEKETANDTPKQNVDDSKPSTSNTNKPQVN